MYRTNFFVTACVVLLGTPQWSAANRLHELIQAGKEDFEVLKAELEKPETKHPEVLNEPDDKGRTPLHLAAQLGDVLAVRLLIEQGANKDAKNSKKDIKNNFSDETPLHVAALNGHIDVVNELLGKGADKEARDAKQWTPLHSAAASGESEVVNALLASEVATSVIDVNNKTPLHVASEFCHANALVALLEKDATIINEPDDKGRTPLHFAAESGCMDAAVALFEKGADIDKQDKKDKQQKTPLHLAAAYAHTQNDLDKKRRVKKKVDHEVVYKYLLSKGAKQLEDADKRTPEMILKGLFGARKTVIELSKDPLERALQEFSGSLQALAQPGK